MIRILISLTAALCLWGTSARAQGGGTSAPDVPDVSDVTGLAAEDYLRLELPPLKTLLENARQNPVVSLYETRRKEEEHALKTERRSWLQYFKLTANYQYGRTNSYAWLTDANLLPVDQYSNRSQNFYNLGATLSIPLDGVIDRRNRIKRQKLKIQETQYEVERWHDEQSLKIIEAYTTALEKLSIMKVKVEAATLAAGQYKVAENDFVNGKIDAAQLSRLKSIETTALSEYEQTRSALNNAILQLEVLSRTRIVNVSR